MYLRAMSSNQSGLLIYICSGDSLAFIAIAVVRGEGDAMQCNANGRLIVYVRHSLRTW